MEKFLSMLGSWKKIKISTTLLSIHNIFRQVFNVSVCSTQSFFNWMCFWHHAICHGSTSLPTRIIEASRPSGISLLQVNNRNTTTRCEMCSKLTIKTPQHHELTSFRCLYCKLYTHFTTCLAFALLTLSMQLFCWAAVFLL